MILNAFAFFDIGDTLAEVKVSPAGNDIEKMTILPDVLPALEELRAEDVRLGILSNRGGIEEIKVIKALENIGILPFFEHSLIIFGPKNSTEIFERARMAVRKLGEEKQTVNQILLFVGENAAERAFAAEADFLVASTPQAALNELRQNQG